MEGYRFISYEIKTPHSLQEIEMWSCLCHPTGAEPLFALGYPRTAYVAQNFDCPDYAYGLGSCDYNNTVDSECYDGPHVAGVRCTESKLISVRIC